MLSRLQSLIATWRRSGARPPAPGQAAADRATDRASRRPITLLDLSERPDPDADRAWRTTIRRRAAVVLVGLGLWAVGIEARLIHLQVVRHEAFVTRAVDQQQDVITLPATRGDIVDRHGAVLAYSVDAEAVAANPRAVEDPAATAEALCAAFGDCTRGEREALGKTLGADRGFAYVRRALALGPDQVRRVREANLPGVYTVAESRRYYPNHDLAAHVLGFVGTDGDGLGGIEARYNEEIRGQNGVMIALTDAHRTRLAPRIEQEPTVGATLELTLDRTLQHIAERELYAAVLEHQARGGTAIIMAPDTGEVLALANYPTYNPNAYDEVPAESRRNRAIQEVYEPGSTFKIVTASAAIEEGVIRTTDLVDTTPGYIQLGARRVDDVGYNGVLSFEDAIIKSSNVAAIKVGLETGAERLFRYVRRYGFGQRLTPDLQGESPGQMYEPSRISDGDLASMAMGYAINVTPLQMATAVSAVANGGRLMQPRFVRAFVRDGQREVVAPTEIRRAVTPAVAATLTTIMEGVVERGTGTRAALDRYRVAGKSGTTARLVDGRYSETEYNASFVGFVPSRRPVFTIVVVIDTPRTWPYYGGLIAAPVFHRIAEAALIRAGVPPNVRPLPPVVVTDAAPAVAPSRRPALVPTAAPVGGPPAMPDVRGLSARAALRVLGDLGLTVEMTGSGVVSAQAPAPGDLVEPGLRSRLQLADRVPRTDGGR